MLQAARVNASVSRINQMLRVYRLAEFACGVECALDGDPRQWPEDVIGALTAELVAWRQEVGPVRIVARTYACVPDGGRHTCVLQVRYEHVGQNQALPSTAAQAAAAEKPGERQSDAAAPARRPISPSLCGNEW